MTSTPLPTLASASVAVGLAMAYHGYKRNNNSLGWGIGWYLFGAGLPLIAGVMAIAQGYGKQKSLTNV